MTNEADRPPGGSDLPPIVDASTIEEVAPGVHVIHDKRVPLVPNIGIVVGDEAALVVDTGMGPENGRRVLEGIDGIVGDRRLYLTVTHFHPEHGFGASAFRDRAVILYNQQQHTDLREKGPGYVELFRTFGPHVQEQLEGVELVDPHIRYDGRAELDLGGRNVLLRQVGPAHTPGDQIVHVPDPGVVFAGDLIETRVFAIFPYFPPDDTAVFGTEWIDVLRDIESIGAELIVPGHGEVGGVERASTAREYIEMLKRETYIRADKGMDAESIIEELAPEVRESRPDWDSPEWIEFGIQCFFDEHRRAAQD